MSKIDTLTEQARALPRTVVGTTLNAARLPLTAAERITGHTGDAEWAPALAFEGYEAVVETALGSLLRDETLLERGRVRQARVDQLRKAAALATVAEQERVEAEQRLEQRLDADEQRREKVQQSTTQQKQQIEKQTRQRKAKVAQSAAQQKQAVQEQAKAAQQRVEREDRAAKLTAVRAESEALEARRDAVAATDEAVAVDEALEATSEARKSGS